VRAFRALLLPLTLCGSLAGCYYWDSGAGPGYTYGLPPSPSSGSFYDSGRSLAPNYGNDSSPGPSQGYDYYGNGCPSGSGSGDLHHGSGYCPNPDQSGDLHHRHWGAQF
jgi:hypothetical protein